MPPKQTTDKRFEIGQRVRMTLKALEGKLDGRKHQSTGVVKGFNLLNIAYVTVLRDGRTETEVFASDFWEAE